MLRPPVPPAPRTPERSPGGPRSLLHHAPRAVERHCASPAPPRDEWNYCYYFFFKC